MAPWSNGREERRKARSSALRWRISSFTMSSIYGCAGNTPTSSSNDMPTPLTCHCRSEAQALELRQALEKRVADCKLQLHPQKTKVVYCKDANRPGHYPEQSFDFLGYTFRPSVASNHHGQRFVAFIPAVGKPAGKTMRLSVRRRRVHRRNDLELAQIAAWVRPVLTGWVRYFGRFYPSKLQEELRTIDAFIVRWAIRKYKRFRGHTMAIWDWLRSLQRRDPHLFAHWSLGPAVR